MLFTGRSMSKDDLSLIVRAGLRVRLVDRRPGEAATSNADAALGMPLQDKTMNHAAVS
jgi:hypothetical protein